MYKGFVVIMADGGDGHLFEPIFASKKSHGDTTAADFHVDVFCLRPHSSAVPQGKKAAEFG